MPLLHTACLLICSNITFSIAQCSAKAAIKSISNNPNLHSFSALHHTTVTYATGILCSIWTWTSEGSIFDDFPLHTRFLCAPVGCPFYHPVSAVTRLGTCTLETKTSTLSLEENGFILVMNIFCWRNVFSRFYSTWLVFKKDCEFERQYILLICDMNCQLGKISAVHLHNYSKKP